MVDSVTTPTENNNANITHQIENRDTTTTANPSKQHTFANPISRACFHFFVPLPANIGEIVYTWFILPLMLLCIIYGTVITQINTFPTPKDSSSTSLSTFSEQRALKLLQTIPHLNQTRPIGSTNLKTFKVGLVNYLQRLQNSISNNTKGVIMDISTQDVFLPSFSSAEQNIIVRISGQNSAYTESFLLTTFYDTLFPSPAGVASSTIATLLEILQNVLHQPRAPHFPIIFLFSTAKVSNFLGLKTFANTTSFNIKRFVNLDAMGSTGKAVMWRAFPSSISHELNYVDTVHADVLGEELSRFSQDLTTGFTILSEIGIPGMDFAFYSNGHTCNTLLDTTSQMSKGSIQHLGDALLSLAKRYCFESIPSPLQEAELNNRPFIYFDYTNLFLVSVSQDFSIAFNSIMIVLCLLLPFVKGFVEGAIELLFQPLIHQNVKRRLLKVLLELAATGISLVGYIFSFALGICISSLTGLLILNFKPMVFYGRPLLSMVPIASISSLLGIVIGQAITSHLTTLMSCRFAYKYIVKKETSFKSDIKLYDNVSKQLYFFTKEQFVGMLLFWCLASFILTISKFRSFQFIHMFCFLYLIVVTVLLCCDRITVIVAYLLCPQFKHWKLKFEFEAAKRNMIAYQRHLDADVDTDFTSDLFDATNSPNFHHQNVKPLIHRLTSLGHEEQVLKKNSFVQLLVLIFLKKNYYWHVVPYFTVTIAGTVTMYKLFELLSFLIPVMGFTTNNTDVTVCALASLLCCFVFINYAPFLFRAMNFAKLILATLCVYIATLAFIFGFFNTYTLEAPKRISVTQTFSKQYSIDNAILFTNSSGSVFLKSEDENSIQQSIAKPIAVSVGNNYQVSYVDKNAVIYWSPLMQMEDSKWNVSLLNSNTNNITLQFVYEETQFVKIQFSQPVEWIDFENDAQWQQIVTNGNQVIYKYGIASTNFVITIPRVNGLQIEYQASYCNSYSKQSSTAIVNFFKDNPHTTIDGSTLCDFLNLQTVISIR